MSNMDNGATVVNYATFAKVGDKIELIKGIRGRITETNLSVCEKNSVKVRFDKLFWRIIFGITGKNYFYGNDINKLTRIEKANKK